MNKQSHPASLAGWSLILAVAIAGAIAYLQAPPAAAATPPAEAAEPAPRAEAAADKIARGKHLVSNLTDADLEAVFAYLRTNPPV